MTPGTVYRYCVLTVSRIRPDAAQIVPVETSRFPLRHKGKPVFAMESGRRNNFNTDLTTS